MKIAIHPDRTVLKDYVESYSDKWAKFLQNRKIEIKWINLYEQNAMHQVKNCDGVMWRHRHTQKDRLKAYKILHTIERYLKIPVFPTHDTAWHYDDKIAQFYIFKALNVPMPDTWVFWNQEDAKKWAEETRYPKIFKLASGASAENVRKITQSQEAINIICLMFQRGIFSGGLNLGLRKESMLSRIQQACKLMLNENKKFRMANSGIFEKGYAYFQEFIPDNEYDTRIVVIGNRAFGYRRYNRPNDFRASGSGIRDFNPEGVRKDCLKVAFETARKLNAQTVGFDFLMKQNKPVVTEITYAFTDWPVSKCPGHWTEDLEWATGSMWPQEAQVEDFIEYIQKLQNPLPSSSAK